MCFTAALLTSYVLYCCFTHVVCALLLLCAPLALPLALLLLYFMSLWKSLANPPNGTAVRTPGATPLIIIILYYYLIWGAFFFPLPFLKVTVEITGKPPHGAAVRTLELLDSSYVRVLADGVVLKVTLMCVEP
jgi:hypothetical protein